MAHWLAEMGEREERIRGLQQRLQAKEQEGKEESRQEDLALLSDLLEPVSLRQSRKPSIDLGPKPNKTKQLFSAMIADIRKRLPSHIK